ncbi:MAG: hypothetical protein Q8891_12295 [Bacteroidota bacterium]|nr:hypothetical protein [Bacteroidota bacterium]
MKKKLLLFFLTAFVALTSTLSGLVMIIDPKGETLNLSLALLKETPFKNFAIPGILLLGVVGGVNLIALFYNIKQHPNRYNWAMIGGLITIAWIIVQMMLIHTIHWLHFLYLDIALIIILISYQLKIKWVF